MKAFTSQFPAIVAAACLALIVAAPAVHAQGAGRFTPQDYHGWSNGAAGSSGGTIYAFPNPYQPQTIAPLPEISGNYATHYLFNPATGQTYADPMFYHGLGALERWDAIQGASKGVVGTGQPRGEPSAMVTRTRTETTTKRRTAPPTPARPAPMAALQEIVDK